MNHAIGFLPGPRSGSLMMPSQKRPSALTAKLPLKAIPIVDPNSGTGGGGQVVPTPTSAPDPAFVPSEKSIAFDPSISEFVPQAAGKLGVSKGH